MAREKIDHLEAKWYAAAPSATCRELLPDHPWLGRADLSGSDLVIPGTSWALCRDLMAEQTDPPPRPRPLLSLWGLASMARLLGERVAASDLSSYDGFWRPLDLIRAGTDLRVVEVVRWDDFHFPAVGTVVRFAIPDGRTFTLGTEKQMQVAWTPQGQEVWADGITWWELACASVIVPVGHPYAADPALVDDALARIDAAAAAALMTAQGR